MLHQFLQNYPTLEDNTAIIQDFPQTLSLRTHFGKGLYLTVNHLSCPNRDKVRYLDKPQQTAVGQWDSVLPGGYPV